MITETITYARARDIDIQILEKVIKTRQKMKKFLDREREREIASLSITNKL